MTTPTKPKIDARTDEMKLADALVRIEALEARLAELERLVKEYRDSMTDDVRAIMRRTRLTL